MTEADAWAWCRGARKQLRLLHVAGGDTNSEHSLAKSLKKIFLFFLSIVALFSMLCYLLL